jgi:ligand-binding sensor domain-containing protein/HAMP domain-containing protein
MKTTATLFFLLALLGSLPAQHQFNNATVFDRNTGMPSNIILAVEKGKDGFIWTGTTDGLCRFDGVQSKIWKNNPDDPRTLPGNEVVCVLPQEGKIWVGTNNGLASLDVAADTFASYHPDFSKTGISPALWDKTGVAALHLDAAGDLWVLFRFLGLFRFLPETGGFEHYPFDETAAKPHLQLPDFFAYKLSIASPPDSDSAIWVGTTAGLQKINKRTRQAKGYYFTHPDKDSMFWQNAFLRIHFHDDGRLYIGSWHAWVHVFDPRMETFYALPMEKKLPDDFHSSTVSIITRKSEQEIWITTSLGVLLYHTGRQEVVFSKKNEEQKRLRYGVHITDEKGRIWLATEIGLILFDPVMQQFSQHSYADLNDPEPGFTLHLRQAPGSDEVSAFPHNADGFFHFNRRTRTWRKTPIPAELIRLKELVSLNPNDLSPDPAGNFTITSRHGLASWSPKTDRLTRLSLEKKLGNRRVVSLAWDRKGQLWLASETLLCYNPATDALRIFEKELDTGNPPQPPNGVDRLFVDSRGNVWFTRLGGFGVWSPERDTAYAFLHFEQPEHSLSRDIEKITEDKQGRVWMVSNDAGLGYAEAAHPERGLVKKIPLDPNRAGSRGYGITTDLAGNVWVWAGKALVKIDAQNLTTSYFSFDYAPNDFDAFSLHTLSDGTLAIGEPDKITFVNSATLRTNDELPEPYITEFRVQEKAYPYNPALKDCEEKRCPPETVANAEALCPLRLRHWENFFSFAFSAKAFTLGKQVRFRYRLLGFQNEWAEAGERRFVNYTNVPGGGYTFQLQAANNEGIWNEKMLEIPVFVATAWWATWWFRGAALLLAAAAGWTFWRWRIGQIRRREQLKTEFEKKLANVEMSALLAQMNPHFLFNSLNSIDSYILKNQSQKASEYLNNFARLMRLILQRSRSNYVSLKDELEALELYIQMEALRFKDRFSYKIEVQEGLDTASLDIPPMLIQPFVENAIWHGLMHLPDRRAGQVMVSVSQQNGSLHCIVQDNGIGRQRATEIKANRSAGSKKSVGMRITQDRIEMINKLYDLNARVEITDLKNEAGEAAGTRVELVIPV